ncbi:MAG: type-F conjugative transfer system pilin assembly protein TrbC [Smithellaceae bacterium]|jgi:type-F conjugative transfer system pilin assembly protein TrbC
MLHGYRITLLIGIILITFVIQAESKEAFIEMPSPCYSVEAIKKDKVYLKEDEKACAQVIQKTLIQTDDSVDHVEVFVGGKLWNTQEFNKKDIDLEKIADVVEEQKKKLEIGIIENNNEEAKRRANEAAIKFYSEQYQSTLNKEMERIKADLFNVGEKENNAIIYPDAIKTPECSLNKESYLYIFISSSMPQNTIRAYVEDVALLKEQNIMIVLRGMIGQPAKLKETAKYVKNIIQKYPECQKKCKVYKARFSIDPKLFEKYSIKEVPAFVYDQHVKTMKPDIGRKEENKRDDEYYKLKGDVSLEYAFEVLRRETKEKELEKLISKFRLEYGVNN